MGSERERGGGGFNGKRDFRKKWVKERLLIDENFVGVGEGACLGTERRWGGLGVLPCRRGD